MRFFLILFLFLSINSFSQEVNKLQDVDKIIMSYDDFSSIEELAKAIDYDFDTSLEKTRAIFTWIALNIDYINKDPFQVGNPKFYIVTDESDYQRRIALEDRKVMNEAFYNRKAQCKGYALLFKEMCDLLAIENEIVLGYIKSSSNAIGFVPTQKNHAWNAVKIDQDWIFLDITMASGYSYRGVWQSRFNSSYFDIQKEIIRNTHYPQDDVWLQYLNQKDLEEFSKLPFYNEAYFKKNFEILNHRTGEIKIRKRKQIVMQVRGIDFNTKVYYKYGEFGELKSTEASFDGDLANINIKSPKSNSVLKVFFDGKEAITYKVTLEK